MSGLECVGWQDSARENLASKTNHSDEQSVLPVFLKNIFVDEELTWSNGKKNNFPVW
jgi:hypothetical protein